MSNERYLFVSYFSLAVVCPGMGVLTYLVLRRPFERIAEATIGSRSPVLKRMLAASMTAAGALGFLGFSYSQNSCTTYEQVVSNRYFLVQANIEQLQGAADWVAWTLLAWGVVMVICLSALRKRKAGE